MIDVGLETMVDTHIHFWDRKHPTLRWRILESPTHPQLGEVSRLHSEGSYTIWEYLGEQGKSHVSTAVHVHAARGSVDPVEESKWVRAMSVSAKWPVFIVGSIPMAEKGAYEVLQRHLQVGGFVGVRDFLDPSLFATQSFTRNLRSLSDLGIVYHVDARPEEFGALNSMLRVHSDFAIVLNHTGFPYDTSPESFDQWESGLRTLSQADNLTMKVSGLGMVGAKNGEQWSAAKLKPYVAAVLEHFGPDRTVLGTNWPVDRLWAPKGAAYELLVSAYRDALAGLSPSERDSVLQRNAIRIYHLSDGGTESTM